MPEQSTHFSLLAVNSALFLQENLWKERTRDVTSSQPLQDSAVLVRSTRENVLEKIDFKRLIEVDAKTFACIAIAGKGVKFLENQDYPHSLWEL